MGFKAVREACSWRCTALSYIPMQCTCVQCSAVQEEIRTEQRSRHEAKRAKNGAKMGLGPPNDSSSGLNSLG